MSQESIDTTSPIRCRDCKAQYPCSPSDQSSSAAGRALTPRQVVEVFPFHTLRVALPDLDAVKEQLIVEFNELTLEHFAERGHLLDPVHLALEIPLRALSFGDLEPIVPASAAPMERRVQTALGMVGKVLNGFGLDNSPSLIDLMNAEPRPASSLRPSRALSTPVESVEIPRIPSRITDGTEWIDNADHARRFVEFVQQRYTTSDRPETKFADLLRDFTAQTGIETGNRWSPRYTGLCASLNMRIEEVPTERRKGGVWHTYLRLKS